MPIPPDTQPQPAESTSGLQVGQRVIVSITDLGFGGEGIARVGEFVVFVPFVIPGEEAEIEITEVKKRFARARLVTVKIPSPDRVKPECRYYGECGGCQYQHIAYPLQLTAKRKQVADLMQRIGGFDPGVVDEVIPCPQPYGYRNRIMIRSQWDKFKQALNIGFIRYDNRLVVDIEECKIAEPILNEKILEVRANPPPKGGLKVVLRVAPEGWSLPRDSFFQNNFFLLPQLVETVRHFLEKAGTRFLIDVYCGVGFFSIELAGAVEKFLGIESDRPAIKAARENMELRGITNGDYICGAAEDLLPGLIGRYDPSKTAVILDPPRTGCHPAAIECILKSRPGQLIYVSCNPATLARDLNVLCATGVYALDRVAPLDMFPQTQHVECVASLRLKA